MAVKALQLQTLADFNGGKESLGKSIEAEVTGAGSLPESIDVSIQKWEQFEFSQFVEVFLDVDMANCKLRWSPVRSSLLEANQKWSDEMRSAVDAVCPSASTCHGVFMVSPHAGECYV